MAFKFNAILKFTSTQANRALDKSGRKFASFSKQVGKANASLGKMSVGVRGLALATAPVALAVGLITKEAASFEAQMSIVQSVLLATKNEMRPLNVLTKQLGATTRFTAVEAGQAAESLSRAGFTMQQTIGALPGVLDAAAASGTELGITASIVADNIGAFGLKATDATRVADALALTTALTNTNFLQLAEGLKFAAPLARQAGFTMEEMASSVGILANAGIKGTLAGTALKNMLNKLAKPSKEAVALFGGKGGMADALFRVVDGQQKLRPMEEIMANIAIAVSGAENKIAAVGRAAEILGLRGTNAFGAFSAQIQKNTLVTTKNFEALRKGAAKTGSSIKIQLGSAIPKLVALRLQIAGAEGTARKMADIRLDNLLGQFILFKSAATGVAIELGSLVTGPFKGLVEKGTAFLSVVATGFQLLSAEGEEVGILFNGLKNNQFKDFIFVARSFAKGFVKGFETVKKTAENVFAKIRDFLAPFIGDVQMNSAAIGEFAVKFIALATVAAPVFAAIVAGAFVIGPILIGLVGTIGLVSSAVGVLVTGVGLLFSPIGIVVGLVALLSFAFLDFVGGIDGLKKSFATLAEGFSKTFDPAVIGSIKGSLKELTDAFSSLFNVVSLGSSKANDDWSNFGEGIGTTVNIIGKAISFLVSTMATFFKILFGALTLGSRAGFGLKSLFGFGAKKEIGKIKPTIPTVKQDTERLRIVSTQRVVEENNKLQTEAIRGKAISAPPSSEELAQMSFNASANRSSGVPTGNGGQSNGTITVILKPTGDLKGMMNKMVTQAQIENAEKNGSPVSPISKRKLKQHGASANW